MTRVSGEEGFSIIEAIVSFAIVSLVLVALYEAIGAGYRGTALVQQRALIIALANSKLAALGASIALHPGSRKSRFEHGVAWQTDITVLGEPMRHRDYKIQAYWLRLRVINRRGVALIDLETVKLAREKQ